MIRFLDYSYLTLVYHIKFCVIIFEGLYKETDLQVLITNLETKKSMREAFGKALEEVGREDVNVVALDADLSGSTQTKFFAKSFPERFFDVGIAEQNLISTAVGLSMEGKIPFAATFAIFATGRTYDQVRNGVCYQNANVKIIGTHGGLTVGEDGATHQSLEDVSLMRGIPNMQVIVPADAKECSEAVKYAHKHNGPVYIRVARNSVPDIFTDDYKLEPKAKVVLEGNDITVFANGEMLAECIKAAQLLKNKNISVRVVNVPFVKPVDIEGIISLSSGMKCVVTVENHSIIGGLGSAVCEVLSEYNPVKVVRIGVEDRFGQSGTPDLLLKHYGLDSSSIAGRIEKIYDSIKSSN